MPRLKLRAIIFFVNKIFILIILLLFFSRDSYASIITLVQFSCSVVSDSLLPHELQHARPPSPSPTPGVHSDSRPSISDAIQPSHPLILIFLPAILIPACASSSPAFRMMYSAYKLNKQGDNIQP